MARIARMDEAAGAQGGPRAPLRGRVRVLRALSRKIDTGPHQLYIHRTQINFSQQNFIRLTTTTQVDPKRFKTSRVTRSRQVAASPNSVEPLCLKDTAFREPVM
ncbi:hypothetical protein EVAR_24839_1 [Eumeta japonica]|uniref:Uncharacterized protein n=1 Tax=Eumeta variegata TaxID=151549 RepID=A0A4C1Y7P2_EUMVA|nr:hypothetical protein EVAR_24839_1 [Eumeta japonica]